MPKVSKRTLHVYRSNFGDDADAVWKPERRMKKRGHPNYNKMVDADERTYDQHLDYVQGRIDSIRAERRQRPRNAKRVPVIYAPGRMLTATFPYTIRFFVKDAPSVTVVKVLDRTIHTDAERITRSELNEQIR